MVNIRRFYMKNKDKKLAVIEYDVDAHKFLRMRLSPKVDKIKDPLMIAAIAQGGYTEIGPEMTLRWVRERIIPPNRMNITEILRAAKLPEYDELGMFIWHKGKCCQDNMYMEELAPDEEPEF